MFWLRLTHMLPDMSLVRLTLHLVILSLMISAYVDQVIGPYGLLATKARIVVTNSIAFLKHFDKLVYLRRGIILESGSYDELTGNTETELYKLM